jgi:hypothetical protein
MEAFHEVLRPKTNIWAFKLKEIRKCKKWSLEDLPHRFAPDVKGAPQTGTGS